MRITDSCPCGATFFAQSVFTDNAYYAYEKWLKRHENCKPSDRSPKPKPPEDARLT